MAVPPHTPLVLLSAIVASSVGFFAWFYRDTPGARPLAVFMLAASVWALAEGLALASPAYAGKVRWTRVAWSVSSVVALAWLATVLAYIGEADRLTRRRLALLAVEPVGFAALVWTNGAHGLVWRDFSTDLADGYVVLTREFGLAFWAHVGYTYLLIAVGAALLVRLSLRTNSHFRGQSTALLVAVFVPMLANALSVFDLVPPQFDLTSLGFVVTGLVVAGAIFRGSLLTVTPATRELGRETIVDEMDDPVIILDGANRVVDLNPAAERLLGVATGAVAGESLETVDAALAAAVDDARVAAVDETGSGEAVCGDRGQGELELDTPGGVGHFDVRVSSLDRRYGGASGRVVSLRDVTRRHRREQRLDVLNRLLRHNLRNELNVVAGNAELLRDAVEATPTVEKRLDHVADTVADIVERSEKLGHLSRELDREETGGVELGPVVDGVAASVGEANPDATVSVDVPEALWVTGGSALELAVEELLTNAVEHGDAPGPSVAVTAARTDGVVELRVADDGPGIDRQEREVIEAGRETPLQHGSGVGLWLVAWVVREYGGTISFADRDDGCTVILRLPTDEASDEREDRAELGGTITAVRNRARGG